jgi:hypothetical protein
MSYFFKLLIVNEAPEYKPRFVLQIVNTLTLSSKPAVLGFILPTYYAES